MLKLSKEKKKHKTKKSLKNLVWECLKDSISYKPIPFEFFLSQNKGNLGTLGSEG